ncbi:unnamed protein product, partial [Darwinula stevensoni]
GKGKAPTEDCGGIWGYYELVETINNTKHPEHKEMMEWMGLKKGYIWNYPLGFARTLFFTKSTYTKSTILKYYIIAGEASGDLHGSNLIRAIKKKDPQAVFRFWGGDLMAEASAEKPIKHYRELAFMGFL